MVYYGLTGLENRLISERTNVGVVLVTLKVHIGFLVQNIQTGHTHPSIYHNETMPIHRGLCQYIVGNQPNILDLFLSSLLLIDLLY